MYVALLRGINVGGKNKLLKTELVSLFEQAGCRDVSTYIQSGNVVFRASPALARRVPKGIASAIATTHGFEVPVVLRSAAELQKVLARNPFGGQEEHVHVGFLGSSPSRAEVRALDSDRSPGDAFALAGREVYLCCPNGLARTKLTVAYFEAVLGTPTTVRSWRTVQKLVELSGS